MGLRRLLNYLSPPRPPAGVDAVSFQCNICGRHNHVGMADLDREKPSCWQCGSTVRMRAIIHALSLGLFQRSIPLPHFPLRKDLHGKGLSDWSGYAKRLEKKMAYVNTYYHRPPLLDITAINAADEASLDFLIATDVFEHVAPPVSRAFVNARRLLRNNGIFILSVPYSLEASTQEHFPGLHQYHLESRSGKSVLINHTAAGKTEEFTDLVFHGGEGDTLEFRLFSRDGLLAELSAAGFGEVTILDKHYLEYGIYWPTPFSLPLMARAGPADPMPPSAQKSR